MQEATQIGWDPISSNHQLPWAAKIFVLYLLVVVTTSLVNSVALLRQLWFLTRSSVQAPRSENDFQRAWERSSNKIQSIKRLVFVTLLLSVLVAVLLLRASLVRAFEQKMFGPALLSGSIVEVLTVFGLGIFVCVVLYAACALFEGMLLRRKPTTDPVLSRPDDSARKG